MDTTPDEDVVKKSAILIARHILETDHSETCLLTMMQQLIHFGDFVVFKSEARTGRPAYACSCGCSYCCHMQVKITPPEAFFIFSRIARTYPVSKQKALHQRIVKTRILTEGKSLSDRIDQKQETPCIFLNKNRCDIYEERPLICRAWHSLSRDSCRTAFMAGDASAEIETAPLKNYVLGMVREAIHDVCTDMQWEYDAYELPIALYSCFHDPHPMANWLLRHPLFVREHPPDPTFP